MRTCKIILAGLLLILLSCERSEQVNYKQTGFLSFNTNGQTLSTEFNDSRREVRFEVDFGVDVTRLVPDFNVPEGCSVLLNGREQVSGGSTVDFSQPVLYEIQDLESHKTTWEVSAVQLNKKILIDASHDGGVWWFPQSPLTGFSEDQWHQGKPFADMLRSKGLEVRELGRGEELKEGMFFGSYIVIRTNGFERYTENELEIYTKLARRGMNLVFFTDHKKYDRVDELGDHLGLKFEGVAYGKVTKLTPHMITKNITSIDYIAGSVLTNLDQNPDIEVLGWLGEEEYGDLNFNGGLDENEPLAPPVMGTLKWEKSKIFFIGDMNGLEIMPQPFIDNLIEWMRD
ncbi:MAG: hypothetical protein NTW82_04560 [Bacteroidia bacterium]|nr:hypothetical protein [Bacteroidia bacterium]